MSDNVREQRLFHFDIIGACEGLREGVQVQLDKVDGSHFEQPQGQAPASLQRLEQRNKKLTGPNISTSMVGGQHCGHSLVLFKECNIKKELGL